MDIHTFTQAIYALPMLLASLQQRIIDIATHTPAKRREALLGVAQTASGKLQANVQERAATLDAWEVMIAKAEHDVAHAERERAEALEEANEQLPDLDS
ncbi:MAG: hypothetical protein G01um101425_859 [Candidatus Peregrinibacteria bacterium Gr01-1014_25]|nr:MAG: hypothetical protein G01um101425_859 [Candidatus Peregrinibacteria bacterium Gr01-1014_25]